MARLEVISLLRAPLRLDLTTGGGVEQSDPDLDPIREHPKYRAARATLADVQSG